jgi:hypothetical protein
VGQPDGPNQEDAHLVNAYSEDLMNALEDWLVEVEVEVEAADETARVEEGAGPRVDPRVRGHVPCHSIQNRASYSRIVTHMCHTKDGQPAKFPSQPCAGTHYQRARQRR